MTLGQILQENRERHGLKREEVSRRLNITQKYIIALETGDYKSLPAKIYVHCFLKLYGNLLALNTQELISLYEKEVGDNQGSHSVTQKNIIKPFTMWSVPRILSALVLLLGIVTFLGYIGTGVYRLVQLPALDIQDPLNNSVVTENFIEVVGKTDEEVQVSINNNPVLADADGAFHAQISLQKGVNIIKIVAKNRHGKEAVEYRKVLYDTNTAEVDLKDVDI